MTDTIFALSSGLPPAGIGVVRISGPNAGQALDALTGKRPAARLASYRKLRDPRDKALLDEGLVLWFPGPNTATGEDLAELHLHGGRAVVASILATLGTLDGLRSATAGEFTRRAFENGRIDLAEAEGIADLLCAETEAQRRSALALAGGALGRKVEDWQARLLSEAAMVEATLDFSDEGDVDTQSHSLAATDALSAEMALLLAEPPAERLHDGIRIVLAGPPNAGKSSIFNILVDRDAAIVSEIAGTTRDRIEAPVALDGLPMVFIDTAGLRASEDVIEVLGVARAEDAVANADIVLWLGDPNQMPADALLVAAKSDIESDRPGLPVSAVTGDGVPALRTAIVMRARALLPRPGALALNARHRAILQRVQTELAAATQATDLLISAEHLRSARGYLDHLTGRAGTEDLLDALFGRFCIGK
jgi:tRNA modification GTPase